MLSGAQPRQLRYLRVSVTDRCNLRCSYCMPACGIPLLAHEQILRFEEIETVVRVAVSLGVSTVRLTGGEPLVKRGIVRLVGMLAAIPGLDDLAMTTNAVLLRELAPALKSAGLRRVNVGLPSLDADAYARITRSDRGALAQALAGVEAAIAVGLSPVKLNVVVMRGVSDDPAPFVELARRLPVSVRFIEHMPMGPEEGQDAFVSSRETQQRVRELIGSDVTAPPVQAGAGPARGYVRGAQMSGSVGFIGAMSEHFCASCNRLRLTADGMLRSCLFASDEVDLRPALRPAVDDSRVREAFVAAMSTKPTCHGERRDAGRLMGQIGG